MKISVSYNYRDELVKCLFVKNFSLESQNVTESLASALESLTEESAREILEEKKFDKISKNTSLIIEQFSHDNVTEKGDFDLKLSGITIMYRSLHARKNCVNALSNLKNYKTFRYRR